jgi:hypothetical protein
MIPCGEGGQLKTRKNGTGTEETFLLIHIPIK